MVSASHYSGNDFRLHLYHVLKNIILPKNISVFIYCVCIYVQCHFLERIKKHRGYWTILNWSKISPVYTKVAYGNTRRKRTNNTAKFLVQAYLGISQGTNVFEFPSFLYTSLWRSRISVFLTYHEREVDKNDMFIIL